MAIPLGRAHVLASTAIREVRSAGIRLEGLTAVGDLRRFEPAVESVHLLGVAADSSRRSIQAALSRLPSVLRFEKSNDSSIKLFTERGDVTVHLTPPDQAGAARVWHTGSSRHVDLLQTRALERGLDLAGARLKGRDGTLVVCPPEDDLHGGLSLPSV